MSPVGRDGETANLVGENYSGDIMDDHEDKIGQALINVVMKGIVVIEQVVGLGNVGMVRLRGALALAGLIHVTLFGCIGTCRQTP